MGIVKGLVDIITNNKKAAIIIAAFLAAVVIAFIVVLSMNGGGSGGEDIEYADCEVSTVHMEQTLTAAGKVTTGKVDTITLPKGKTLKAAAVKKDEAVTEGQPLVFYTDGTHTDAPADGIIERINAPKNGGTVSGSDTIKFSRTKELYLKVTIPEDEINNVAKGDTAVIIVNAKPHSRYEGEIIEKTDISSDWLKKLKENSRENSNANDDEDEGSDENADEDDDEDEDMSYDEAEESETESAYFTVNIRFQNDGSLKPGMSASCVITISSRDDVLAVPIEAVGFENNKAFVYKTKGNDMEKCFVETGGSDPINVEIVKGLKAGDVIKVVKH